jgi:hypothetical protein
MKREVVLMLIVCLIVPLVGAQPKMSDPEEGTNPKTVTAYQISPIKVDGDLSDWPAGLEKRVCKEFYPGYQVTTPEASTQENYFMVAWNDQKNQVYVAGWSTDDIAVLKLSEWSNPDLTAMAGATWLYDRWEIYFEWDNTDEGVGQQDGTVQYCVGINDPDSPYVDQGGFEVDAAGNPIEGGTMFFITGQANLALTADGRPWRSQAKMVVKLDDPNDPYGSYTKVFEAAITGWTYYAGDDNTDADVLDLGPDVNEGTGIGFDVTMMDRDGQDRNTVDRNTADNEGAWLGWSSGSKNANPQLLGTMLFSMTFAAAPVTDWSLY